MLGNGEDVDASLSEPRATGVPQGVERDAFQAGQLARRIESMPEVVRFVAVLAGENQIVVERPDTLHALEFFHEVGRYWRNVRIAVFRARYGDARRIAIERQVDPAQAQQRATAQAGDDRQTDQQRQQYPRLQPGGVHEAAFFVFREKAHLAGIFLVLRDILER